MHSKSYFEIQSANKLSADIIKRLMAKRLVDVDKHDCAGASKNMILAMIHFSHICNIYGDIYNFKTSDLSLVLRCNKRSTFNVINDLVQKGFITVSGDNWSGVKNIHLLNNDFSKYSKQQRYLNTNRDFFNYRNSEDYDRFADLSLFAMRTFLNLLLNYNADHGYHISYDTLCSQIHVKKRALIGKYILEIEHVVKDEFYHTTSNSQKRLKYGSLIIHRNLNYLKPRLKVSKYQDTYYNYKWQTKLRLNDYEFFTDVGTWQEQSSRLCAIVYTFLEKNLHLDVIESVVDKILSIHGVVSEDSLYDLYGQLNNLTFS